MLFSTLLFAVSLPALAQASAAHPPPSRTVSRRAATVPLPYNTDAPASTPLFVPPPIPSLLPIADILGLVGATTASSTSLLTTTLANLVTSTTSLNVPGIVSSVTNLIPSVLCLFWCSAPPAAAQVVVAVPGAQASAAVSYGSNVTCLTSAMNDTVINSLLFYGGADTTIFLCPGAVINLSGPIVYTAARQVITTKGLPTGDLRATLVVTGGGQSCAVYGTCPACNSIALTNVQVNGNRPALGWIQNGQGLIEMGGSNTGQVVDSIHSYEPRGWTALHLIEGTSNSCSGASVKNSQFGPSGHGPSGTAQFRMVKARRDIGTYAPGQWADGISLACKQSTVSGNTIIDATDGAIVVFGAPGSKITGNNIIASTRQLLGGINAVDFGPFYGDYANTVVSGNTITASGAMIKVGLALGPLTWSNLNSTGYRNSGGSFTNNMFTTAGLGYFGYGISVSGYTGGTVTGNKFTAASFGGVTGAACQNSPAVPFGAAYVNQYTTSGMTLQSSIVNAGAFCFMICNGPGPITKTGITSS